MDFSSALNIKTGYRIFSNTFSNIFNVVLAALLLFFSFPFFVVISAAIKLTDNGPIFYRGERLGKNKEIFTMYKFRTLVPNAEQIIGAELLTSQYNLVTKVGKFLRETRLDELPQIFNVLKGDMAFIGPRPERAVIYDKFCKDIKGYDKRFSVKPGLIGYSQLFTPHNSTKKLRTHIDNLYIQKKQNFAVDIVLIFYTAYLSVKYATTKIVVLIWKKLVLRMFKKDMAEKRTNERIYLNDSRIFWGDASTEQLTDEGLLVNINDEAFLMYADKQLKEETSFKLEILIKKKKKKTAFCKGIIYKGIALNDKNFKYAYVIKYTPVSPLNSYMIHQYFLHKSVAQT
ncbi:MAG: sugar transferase [Nitrospirae bacterium YQR-1]